MNFLRFSTCSIIAAGVLLAGCGKLQPAATSSGPKVDNPVAIVNGYPVSREMLDLYAQARTRQAFDALPAEQQQEVLSEALDLVAIATDGQKRGLDEEPENAARIELQKLNVLAQANITRLVSASAITDEALQSAYQDQYVAEPRQEYKARHILLESEEDAMAVITELEGGADFAELAKNRSTGPSASNGGDLGWFTRDAMVKPFADAVAGMESGTYSKTPVQTQFGYHVILAEGTREAAPPDFEGVKEGLRSGLQQDLVQNFIESTRSAAEIEVLIDTAGAGENSGTASVDDD